MLTLHSISLEAWKDPKFLFWSSNHNSVMWNSLLSGLTRFPFWWSTQSGVSWSLARVFSTQALQVPLWLLQSLSEEEDCSFFRCPPCTFRTLALCLLTSLSRRLTLPTSALTALCACRRPATNFLRKPHFLCISYEDKEHSNSAFHDVLLYCVLLFWAIGYWRLYNPSLAARSSIHIFSGIKTLKGLSLKIKSQLEGRFPISLNAV